MGNLVSECIKNIMGTRRNPIDENDDPEDFQDEEDQEQWRQTLIYIGGALNNKFHSLWIIGEVKSNFIYVV